MINSQAFLSFSYSTAPTKTLNQQTAALRFMSQDARAATQFPKINPSSVVRLLLEAGADYSLQNRDGATALEAETGRQIMEEEIARVEEQKKKYSGK